MKKELSIDTEKNEINLENTNSDKVVAVLKSIVGEVPIIGSALSEIIGVVIPNQKADRIKLFAEVLSEKVKYLEKNVIDFKIKTQESTDLLEDALRQSSRALNKERIEQIASVIKNSLTKDEIDHQVKKKLFSILEQLNDVDIIRLKEYDLLESEKDDYYEKHKDVLDFERAPFDATLEEFSFEVLFTESRETLRRLNLIDNNQITHLGNLLLLFMDMKNPILSY